MLGPDVRVVHRKPKRVRGLCQHRIPIRPCVALAVQPVADVVVDLDAVKRPAFRIAKGIAHPVRVGQDQQPALRPRCLHRAKESHLARDPVERPQADDVIVCPLGIATVQFHAVEPQQRCIGAIRLCVRKDPVIGEEQKIVSLAGVHLGEFGYGLASIRGRAVQMCIAFVPRPGDVVAKNGHRVTPFP